MENWGGGGGGYFTTKIHKKVHRDAPFPFSYTLPNVSLRGNHYGYKTWRLTQVSKL